MKKVFTYILVNIFTWNPDKSLEIVREFLGDNTNVKNNVKNTPNQITVHNSPLKPKDKKSEIIDSLNYLKSKTNKTKQDKDSIYTLEMILKNLS
jgi:hypothetical protein